MKTINNYIQEKLKLNKSVINKHQHVYTLFPKTKYELIALIQDEIEKNGNKCSLNHIDVSKITDMESLFLQQNGINNFNGDISKWDVSNVKTMSFMFGGSDFNGDISEWNVSKVESMFNMFNRSIFNGDISKWDVSKVDNMGCMFYKSKFNGNISNWNVSNVKNMSYMFEDSDFKQNISNWNINKNCRINWVFDGCPIKNEFKPKLPPRK